MDIRKGKLNISVSLAFQTITMILAVLVKRTLIDICGNEVNGLNALFISIIGFLAVAELGVGHAITFCMYKPIVEGDTDKVAALFQLFQKIYLLIGMFIFFAGLAVTPFLRFFAKDYHSLDVNIYATFVFVLISVTVTYLFSAKTALINAYKNNYITTAITQGGIVLQYVLQITVLYFTRSFEGYLICRIVAVFAQWIASEIVVRKRHAEIIANKARLDPETKNKVRMNVKAMLIHKIGSALVNSLDSVIISAFVGVVALGEYSNYTMILSSMTAVIALIFTSLTSIVGHLYASEDKKTVQKYYECFHLINFVIGAVFFLGYYAVIDQLIAILFSAELIVSKQISFVITLNGFVRFMRQSVLIFRDASGTFYQDRWKPLFEGIVNVALSVLLVKLIGVSGVLLATVITNLLICHLVEPYVLYKYAFRASPGRFCLKNYGMMLLFAVMLIVLDRCLPYISNLFVQLIANGFISIALSFCICGIMLFVNREQRKLMFTILRGE